MSFRFLSQKLTEGQNCFQKLTKTNFDKKNLNFNINKKYCLDKKVNVFTRLKTSVLFKSIEFLFFF